MLGAGGNMIRPEDGLRIQKDVYAGFLRFLAGQLVGAYGNHRGQSRVFDDAMELLRTWDGQMDRDHAAPLIATLAYQYLRKAIADRASPGNGEIYASKMAPAVVQHLLQQRPAGWFGDYNQVLLQAFADGMEEGERMQGKDPKRWKWGKYMYLAIDNPVVTHVPVVGKYFDIAPTPMSGGSTSVKQTTKVLGPSERMDMAAGEWDASLASLPIGESGHIASPHYRDQWDAYYNGQSFPMRFAKTEVKSAVMFVPGK